MEEYSLLVVLDLRAIVHYDFALLFIFCQQPFILEDDMDVVLCIIKEEVREASGNMALSLASGNNPNL